MIEYVSVYLVNVLFNTTNKNKFFYFLFVTMLILMLGLRGIDVGVDTQAYYYSFNLIDSGDGTIKDFIYYLISKAIALLGMGPEIMIFLFSIITILPISYVLYKESPYPVISFSVLLAFGFYAMYFNIMRQGAAMSLGLLSVYYLLHKSKVKSFIFIFFAVLTHLSSLVLLPYFILLKASKGIKIYIVSFLWFLSIISILNASLFFNILNTFSFFIPSRFSMYLQLGETSNKGFSFIFDQLIFLFVFICYLLKDDEVESEYLFLSLVGIVFLHLVDGVKYVDRIAFYYYIFCVIGLPIAISNIKEKSYRFSVVVLFVLLFFIQYMYRASVDPHRIFPYYTIFNL